jgi:hypothetical protein
VIAKAKALAARAYFGLCLMLGRTLRAATYSTVQVIHQNGRRLVRKRRRSYAFFLIWMSVPLVRVLDGGVRVLPQREWEQRERRIYETLYGASIGVEADGVLVLPHLAGRTLAALLEDPQLGEAGRKRAIELATVALAGFHRQGFTHADAMAENLLVDLEADVAYWFDFETIHDASRPLAWRRADDLRALLFTCLLRTAPEKRRDTVASILDVYADPAISSVLVASFTSVWRRSLALHLLQARLSFQEFCEIRRLLRGAA